MDVSKSNSSFSNCTLVGFCDNEVDIWSQVSYLEKKDILMLDPNNM